MCLSGRSGEDFHGQGRHRPAETVAGEVQVGDSTERGPRREAGRMQLELAQHHASFSLKNTYGVCDSFNCLGNKVIKACQSHKSVRSPLSVPQIAGVCGLYVQGFCLVLLFIR